MPTISINNSFCKLEDFDINTIKVVKQKLTYTDEEVIREKQMLYSQIKRAAGRKQGGYIAMLKQRFKDLGPDQICWLDDNNCFPTGLIHLVKEVIGSNYSLKDQRKLPDPYLTLRWENRPHPMRYYQQEAVDAFMKKGRGVLQCAVGCHAKDTPILMYDGTIKKVQDVIVGDKLMGPDSKPREVLRLYNGEDKMYKIIPVKGEPFIVNQHHVLSVQRVKKINKKEYGSIYKNSGLRSFKGHNPITNLTVLAYINKSKDFKLNNKLYRTNVAFSNKNILPISAYNLGTWLGDGDSRNWNITTMDKEIQDEFISETKNNDHIGFKIINDGHSGKASRVLSFPVNVKLNEMNILLKQLNIFNNKHIPHEYLTSSREQRLELLAGLMDTDGSLSNGVFDFIQKNKFISEQVCYLARSLGLAAYMKECRKSCQTGAVGTYWRVSISGDCSIIPNRLKRKQANKRLQKKDVLRTGFKVESIGIGSYYGFEVDQDHLYLLGDFTVTHNSGKTRTAAELIKQLSVNTCFVVPSSALQVQAYDVFSNLFGAKNVQTIKSTSIKSKKKLKPIRVVTIQTLASLNKQGIAQGLLSDVDFLAIDECHRSGSESFTKLLPEFANIYYRLGLSGTYLRNDSKTLDLWGVCGEIVYNYPASKATKEGYLTPVEFNILKLQGKPDSNYQTEYQINYGGMEMLEKIKDLIKVKIPHDKQILILVDRKASCGHLIYEYLKEQKITCTYMTGDDHKDDIAKAIKDFNDKKIRILLASQILGEGCDIRSTDHLIMARGGKSEIAITQAVGRAVRLYEGKKTAYVWDFNFRFCKYLSRHIDIRIENYEKQFAGKVNYYE